jgi:CheY-like chemotaxis protein
MRQPLNALGLLCEALRLQALSDRQEPIVRSMKESVEALETQIDRHFRELQTPPPALAPAPWRSTPTPPRVPVALGAAPEREAARGRRVVVVDDDAAARVGLVLLLEAWDVQVQALASVAAVRDWLAERPAQAPDLVILDYHLPKPGEGLEALRLMRAAWPGRVLRALLITGDDRAALSNALTDGSLECLIKPVMPGPLLQAMQRQLRADASRG